MNIEYIEQRLAEIKRKPHGMDVDWLIVCIEHLLVEVKFTRSRWIKGDSSTKNPTKEKDS